MAVSVFDPFKIGTGPSSSHTVGPKRTAWLLVQRLASESLLVRDASARAELYRWLG